MFNPAIETARVNEATRALSSAVLPPIIQDLDGDGINEIVVLDGSTIRMYQNTTLGQITGTFSQNATAPFGFMIAFNIDNDAFVEIILSSQASRQLDILEWNGTTLGRQKSFDLSSVSNGANTIGNDAGHVIGCDSVTQRCALAFTTSGSAGSTQQYGVVAFNSTNIGSGITLATVPTFGGGGVGFAWCQPRIRAMSVADIDADGVNEYVFNIIRVRGETVGSGTHNEVVYLNSISIGSTLNILNERNDTKDLGDIIATGTTTCTATGALNYISPVLVMDGDVGEAGQEIIYGAQVGTTDITTGSGQYNLFMHRGMGALGVLDQFPEAALPNVAGVILSNPFRADALANDGRQDFCILGMAPKGSAGSGGQSEINVLCGSRTHTAVCAPCIVQGDHAEFDGQQSYNISSAAEYAVGSWNIMAHAAQMKGDTTSCGGSSLNGDDLDEIVSSYGILSLDYCSGLNTNDNIVTTDYANTKGDAVVYALDIAKNNPSLADLLYMTSTNLWYIDDGHSNEAAFITSQSYNPCITSSTIKQNSTVGVTLIANDEQSSDNLETDLVSCNITAYVGTVNEQAREWSSNASAGTSIPFFFQANVTGTFTLTMRCRDTGNPSVIDSRNQQFSVASDGLQFGDSSCTTSTQLPDAVTTPSTNTSRLPSGNNTISNAVAGINEMFGLGSTVIWLILMVIVAIGIWMTGHGNHAGTTIVFGLIMFVEFLLFLVGAYLGFISTGAVITIIVVAVAIIGLLFIRPIIGGSN